MPNRQAVALRKCQLAGHKRAGPKTKNVLQCLQLAGIANRQCKHGCKKKRKKKRKKRKGKRRQDANQKQPLGVISRVIRFLMAASPVVVRFTWKSLGALCAALVAHAEKLNSILEPSLPYAEKVQEEM